MTIADSITNTGSFSWTVPNTLAYSNLYRCVITSVTESGVLQISSPFTITPGVYSAVAIHRAQTLSLSLFDRK